MTLRVALVAGPMYDGLYASLPDDVEVLVHADHPTLNREVAQRLLAGERLDLIATHGKYAPSQRRWLRRLDGLVDDAVVAGLAPGAVELCRFDGDLLCLPRLIDVRVLWWRNDRMAEPPATWDDVVARGGFGFTGRESGLFGLFYELVTGEGGRLFVDGRPTLDTPEADAAVRRIVALAAAAGRDVTGWHYDDVDDALVAGEIDMAAAWPGGYGRIAASEISQVLSPAAYPGGWSYSGCHAWAIPTTCGDVDAALELLTWLASSEAGTLDAASGSIPANEAAMAAHEPRDDTDAERLAITRSTIATSMLTYPPLEAFPAVEDAGWSALRDAIRLRTDVQTALVNMQRRARAVLEGQR